MIVIAHRGAPAEAIENTRSAFQAALRSGAVMLETDLHLTLDGHLVIHHDPTTKRLMGVNLTIADTPLDKLITLRHANGDGLLTLAELFALVDGQLPINVELKGRGTGATLVRLLREHRYAGRILVSSQHWEELEAVHQGGEEPDRGAAAKGGPNSRFLPREAANKFREIADRNPSSPGEAALTRKPPVARNTTATLPTGPVVEKLSAAVWKRLEARTCQFVSLGRRAFSAEVLVRLHALKLQLYVYTVNDPKEMVRFAAAGVDAIFTDNPGLAVRVLKRPEH
jgi:glycerophosphoryl diester phosphodiesterase